MAFHPEVIRTLSELHNQERVREAVQDRLAASAEAGAHARPTVVLAEALARRKAGTRHGPAGEGHRTIGALRSTQARKRLSASSCFAMARRAADPLSERNSHPEQSKRHRAMRAFEMTDRDSRSPEARWDEPAQAVFQQHWRIYRTMVEENYLFHREAYACLHRILVEEVVQPFHFLDIACGDASASMAALHGTRIAHYHGIDLSAAALELAHQALAALACPVTLQHADFVQALGEYVAPVDVAWIGLSLHHLQTPEKLAVLRQLRRIVGENGLLLLYEIASPDGEDRAGWLRRYERQHVAWTAYSPADWAVMWDHVLAADFPETSSGWQGLGREAGFGQVQEVFIAPSNLLRMYRMNAIPS